MSEQQNEGLRSRYNVLEKEFNNKVDALGIEFATMIDKEKMDQDLSTYCKKFVQTSGNVLSVRMMIPSEYGLPSVLTHKIELIFAGMFPGYEFR